jgi:predicted nucleic acid-binding Zn ribbon protein
MAGFFASVSTILKTVTHRQGLDHELLEYRLLQEWPQIVGPQIAAHSRPDHIRFKKLFLVVESSVWLQHLTFLKPALLEKLHEAVGAQAVTEIVLRVGEVQQAPRKDTHAAAAPTPPPEPSAEDRARAEAMTASVTDPELRERLTTVMANLLRR